MPAHFATIEDVENRLSGEFTDRVAAASDISINEAESKFITYDIFPTLGWGLVEAGTCQAEAYGNPALLYEMLSKLVSLLYRSLNQFDARGIHISSGYDYSQLVELVVYAAAQNRTEFVSKLFGSERPLSKAGYPPRKHAANLLVALNSPSWKHIDKAISQAEQFVNSKSNSKIDKAFVRYFLGLIERDGSQCSSAIAEFADLYCKSDWGRYKPFTKPVFLYGLLSFANQIHPDIVPTGSNIDVLGESWSRLWTRYEERINEYMNMEYRFTGNLAFLNIRSVEL